MIIHIGYTNSTGKLVYLCNQAYTANPDKLGDIGDITCKNCLKKVGGK